MAAGCNKKCRSLESKNSGAVVGLYDFKDCYIYAKVDSNVVIRSDSDFTKYKTAHFIHCKSGELDVIDFSKNMLLGYRTLTVACNAAFNRHIAIDTATKVYLYEVTVEKCKGCGTELASNNFVIAPQLPAGYTLKFSVKEK